MVITCCEDVNIDRQVHIDIWTVCLEFAHLVAIMLKLPLQSVQYCLHAIDVIVCLHTF